MGNLEQLVEYFIPQFFCNYYPENPNFLLAQAQKARSLGAKKSLKPLSVHAFRFNQQALINYLHFMVSLGFPILKIEQSKQRARKLLNTVCGAFP